MIGNLESQAGNQKISEVVTSLTHRGFCFFSPIIPNESTVFITLPHKIIVYIINNDHICKLCMCMRASEE